jgi:hypothetical protein
MAVQIASDPEQYYSFQYEIYMGPEAEYFSIDF